MKHNHHIFIIFLFLLSSCVSVQLPQSSGKKADSIEYKAPSTPFKKIDDKTADASWNSQKTGNSISFLTDCNNNDTAIEQMKSDTINTLSKLKIIKDETTTFNNREALVTTAQGELDGIPVQMKVLVFKKNSCSFLLTYVAVKKSFDIELNIFNNFLEGFKVP